MKCLSPARESKPTICWRLIVFIGEKRVDSNSYCIWFKRHWSNQTFKGPFIILIGYLLRTFTIFDWRTVYLRLLVDISNAISAHFSCYLSENFNSTLIRVICLAIESRKYVLYNRCFRLIVKSSIYCFYWDLNFMSNDRFNPREMIERFMKLWKKNQIHHFNQIQ